MMAEKPLGSWKDGSQKQYFLDHGLLMKNQEAWLAGVHEPQIECPSVFPSKQTCFHTAQNEKLTEANVFFIFLIFLFSGQL